MGSKDEVAQLCTKHCDGRNAGWHQWLLEDGISNSLVQYAALWLGLQQRCVECGKALPNDNFWQGTGDFAQCFYCDQCWVAWTERQNMGQDGALRAAVIG